VRLIADDEQGRDLGRALVPISGADRREVARRLSLARMPKKTHKQSCRAAALLYGAEGMVFENVWTGL
jgi:hypothetical protein